MADAYVSEIRLFGFPFTPVGWLPCNGQMLQVQSYARLFALIGITYGGDGRSTFALPNLQNRAPLGSAPNSYPLGKAGGASAQSLNLNEVPPHTHGVRVVGAATQTTPGGSYLASPGKAAFAAPGSGGTAAMAPQMLGATGGNQPHENMPPHLVMNYCINIDGEYPSFD